MKNFTKFLTIAILGLAFSAKMVAQSATATASATIITPLTITNASNMSFGNIAVNGAGTVILSPAGGRTPSANISLPTGAAAGTVTAASFNVAGQGALTYAITLPSSDYTITRVSGSETMTVNAFTSNPSGTGALTGGAQVLNVGATLNISAGQVPGTYTNATGFTVSVNYN